jgi:23S rRNA (uridine2552-2'-O)-methyltransferase
MGHQETDHLRAMVLVEAAADFAVKFLSLGGSFVAKVLQGRDLQSFLMNLRTCFAKVALFKPKASRAASSELYVVATGFNRSAIHAK